MNITLPGLYLYQRRQQLLILIIRLGGSGSMLMTMRLSTLKIHKLNKVMKTAQTMIYRFLGVFCIALLSACDPVALPQYWLCQGSSVQKVYDQHSVLIEKYTGEDPIMLERFGQKLYQFLAPAFSGEYHICSESSPNHILLLKSGSCTKQQDSVMDSAVPLRSASFNLKTGDLSIEELRISVNKRIMSEGQYLCRDLGNSFSFNDFNHVQN